MKKKLLLSLFFSGTILVITGCQNAYSQFYTPYMQKTLKPTSKVSYYTYTSESEIENIISKGYSVIGYSGFTSVETATREQAISQAKKVGADIVMVTWKFQNTENYSAPVMNYTPGTSSTTYSNANAYGNNGSYAYGSGTSTTYTQGTYSTSYVQRTANRYAYGAYYLKKIDIKKLAFGVLYGVKTTEITKNIGTNSGCPIKLVFENTPAYFSDIMKDDIVLKANNQKVFSCEDFSNILTDNKIVSLEIWRNKNIININDIKLNK